MQAGIAKVVSNYTIAVYSAAILLAVLMNVLLRRMSSRRTCTSFTGTILIVILPEELTPRWALGIGLYWAMLGLTQGHQVVVRPQSPTHIVGHLVTVQCADVMHL